MHISEDTVSNRIIISLSIKVRSRFYVSKKTIGVSFNFNKCHVYIHRRYRGCLFVINIIILIHIQLYTKINNSQY
jgi:hypothetical protein